MEQLKKIQESQISLVLILKSNYQEILPKIISFIEKNSDKICYISLNRPYNSLSIILKKKQINLQKFIFIDTVGKSKSKDNIISVSSPSAYAEIGIAYENAIKKNYKYILFDSVSTLLLYGTANSAAKFLHSLINKSRSVDGKAVLIALAEDKDTELMKNLYVLVDEIIEIKS